MTFSDSSKEWFEVWCVEGVSYIPAYLVVVTPNPANQSEIIVLDITKGEIIFKGKNYEEVYEWLTEDEFSFINGRIFQ